MLAVMAACVSSGGAGPPPTTTRPRPTATSQTPSAFPSPPPSCAEVVLDRLTLPQRVGQLFALGLASDPIEARRPIE